MLYLVGLGLSPSCTSLRALEVLKKVQKVYLDTYTTPLREEDFSAFEEVVGRPFLRADRHLLEEEARKILEEAVRHDVAIAVVGDPLAATTHVTLYVEALRRDIGVAYVPGTSILSVAPSLSGLQHYRFGRTVTVPARWQETPSFYEKIHENQRAGLHTLLLLDIGLTIPQALETLLHWEREKGLGVLSLSDLVVGIARACFDDCMRVVGTVEELESVRWPDPPHVLVLPGPLHPVEEETLYVMRRYGDVHCQA